MPVILIWLGELLLTQIGAWAIQALIGVGVGLASYKLVISPVQDAIRDHLASAGPIVGWIGFVGVDVGMTIILSAWAGRMAVGAARVHLSRRRAG
jgi:hypothetical protein